MSLKDVQHQSTSGLNHLIATLIVWHFIVYVSDRIYGIESALLFLFALLGHMLLTVQQ